jgi:Tol biopolymer transport system component
MSDERFLANQGDQVFSVAPRIDNEVGELAFASVILGIGQNPAAGAEGSGRLAVVEMEAVAEGQTTLELQEVHLVDSNQRSQPLASITGSVVIATLPGSPVTAPAPPTPYVAATPAPRVSQLVSTDSKETQLTFEGFAGSPVWSPDGSKVAFVKRTEDQMVPDLWVMNADGSGQRKLADNAYWPAWSSDGQMLIYTSKIGQGVKQRRGEIWVVRVDGTGHRKLTDSDFNRARWLPDVRVAFLRDGRLYSVNSEGQEQTFLSALNLAGQFHETSFIISPNGTKLAYHSRNRLWIANVDGTQAVEISKGFDGAPENLAWSPDGTQVVYVRPSMGVLPELWVVNADGTDARMLARGEYEHFEFPTWSPDSRTIAFVRRPTGSGTAELSEIYVVNVDGSGLRRVTDNHFNEGFLAWSPDGSKIAFTRVEMNGVEPVTQTIWVLEIR